MVCTHLYVDISQKKVPRMPKIKFTEFKKLKKLKCPSKDASVPLEREKKAITSWEGRRDLGGKVDGGGRGRGEPGLLLGAEGGGKD